jgi:hypothetical protein
VRILFKKIPHPNLLPEPCMAQEKGLSILISLPINDHLLIYERDLIGFHQVLGMLTI